MEMKLELIMVPVTDVDVAKAFYEKVGFVVDHDQSPTDDIRFVQPPRPARPARSRSDAGSPR